MKKVIAMLLALVLVIGATVAGTLAWLTDKTDPITNTFTVGDIKIKLDETFNTNTGDEDPDNDCWTGKVLPGVDLTKDPVVTVEAKSEDCWLFVKLVENNWPTNADGSRNSEVDYQLMPKWKVLDAKKYPGVYYYEDKIAYSESDFTYDVLVSETVNNKKVNQIKVSENLTKADLQRVTGDFTLTISAYACQYTKSNTANFSAEEAWLALNPDLKN